MKEGGIFGNHPTSRHGDLRRYEGIVIHKNVSRGHKMYGFRVADRRWCGCDFYSVRELRDLGHADVRCAQRGGRSDERDAAHVSLARRRLVHSIRAVDGVLAGQEGGPGGWSAASGFFQPLRLGAEAVGGRITTPAPRMQCFDEHNTAKTSSDLRV